MNPEQAFVAFRKFVEQDEKYYKRGQTGIIEEVLAYFGLPVKKFDGVSKCVHEDHLEILQDFLRNQASEEQVNLVNNIATKGGQVPVTDPGCESAGSVFVSAVMNKDLYPDMDMIHKGIKSGIHSTGNVAYFLNETAHNDNITKIMREEIRNCKFLVADFTHQNWGVYYEAGYAEALGKTVIHLCQEDDFNKVHFDIKQTQFILWKDEQDLAEKLKEQIENSGLAMK